MGYFLTCWFVFVHLIKLSFPVSAYRKRGKVCAFNLYILIKPTVITYAIAKDNNTWHDGFLFLKASTVT
jgi:hypothetical protein